MTCSERIVELVECARHNRSVAELDPDLRIHLSLCARCSERWDRERQLSAQFRTMRIQTAALGSPARRRADLLRDFAGTSRRAAIPAWAWALSAAAALFLAIFAGHQAGKRTAQPVFHEAGDYVNTLSNDAGGLSSDDFIAIPYAPPLAPGEMVRMVHADLYPEALAGMGVEVDPSWAGDLPVDLVTGEDGLPRAVRIAESGQ